MNLSYFFSARHSFLRLLTEIEDMYFIRDTVVVLHLIWEYENYLTYIHVNLHYCEVVQMLSTVKLI